MAVFQDVSILRVPSCFMQVQLIWGYCQLLLTELACRNAPTLEKPYKLADAGGLHLRVSKTGTKGWRWKSCYGGKEKLLPLGLYPNLLLKEARLKRDVARAMLAAGPDPAAEKQEAKKAARYQQSTSFEVVVRAAIDLAHRITNHASDIFVFAISSDIRLQDPAATIRRALAPTDLLLRPALVDICALRQLLIDTEACSSVKNEADQIAQAGHGIRFHLASFITSSLCGAGRQRRDPVPNISVHGDWQLAEADQRCNLVKIVSGSWLYWPPRAAWLARGTFTIMNERASVEDRDQDRRIIDLMLAHVQAGVEPIYNRSSYLPRRREIAQQWADMLLEGMPPPEMLLPIQGHHKGVS